MRDKEHNAKESNMSKQVTAKAVEEIRVAMVNILNQEIYEYAEEIKDQDDNHEYSIDMMDAVVARINEVGLV